MMPSRQHASFWLVSALERVGFRAMWHDLAAAFRRALRARRVTLGAEWDAIDAELRAFAENVRAEARLAELV